MRKLGVKLLVSILLVVMFLVIFIVWDNTRIIVVQQDIAIDDLPSQLEGFRILQVSDLHEQEFGDKQKRLIKTINSLDYDAIVFTGDILDGTKSTNYEPFYALIEGIDNKENSWFVSGNEDPYRYQVEPVVEKSTFIKGMEKRGVKLLESIDTIAIDGAAIHFVDFEFSIITAPEYIGKTNGIFQAPYVSNEKYVAYQEKLLGDMSVLDEMTDSDVLIALNHYPVVDVRIDYIKNEPSTLFRNYDLIIAGHYHGGQFRLPFIGALFVPEPWYENSFFPPKDRVKGLWEYNNTKQYVSTGLGGSGPIPFLKFRLFNPPEINLLTLK